MWSNQEKKFPERGFSTPPASWRSPISQAPMPMSERKSIPSGCRRDLFHVVHKVPAGDSPYVKAKHVQLIDKDPSKAISLFWAAINAGDRVDSALKDMAVVMKQLNRSDEAIEAIKSFRHLCPIDSQESLDNVLVELLKRSGRIEEEIEMLHHKLKNIEEGIAFSGKKTKTARSQGRKIQITVEQERSRVFGNLAWAYLQHHDYGLAEQFYRKALALEPDYNKQCNLAFCLMHMNRIPEAKSLLQAVNAAHGSKEMDDSYVKSFERAILMLTELDLQSVLRPTRDDKDKDKSFSSPAREKPKEVASFNEGGLKKEPVLSDKCNRRFHGGNHSQNCPMYFQLDNDWRKSNYFESPGERSRVSSKMRGNWTSPTNKQVGSHKKMLDSPTPVLYTQPRRVSWRSSEGDQARGRLEEDTSKKQIENPMAHSMRNLDRELLAEIPDASISNSKAADTAGNNKSSTKSGHKSWADIAEEEEDLSPCFSDWGFKEDRNDENADTNIDHQSPAESISQRLETFDLKDSTSSPRTPSARRSLCFDGAKDSNTKMKKNRLQVFCDITPSQDSP